MKKIEFQAGPVSCSVNPLSFDCLLYTSDAADE